MGPKIKSLGGMSLRIIAIVMGWCLIMVSYFSVYDLFERANGPISVGSSKYFDANNWDNGYFFATGSLSNESAVTPGDELVLGTTRISCNRANNNCTITTASVFDGFLSLDVSDFDIEEWGKRYITFSDNSAICDEQYYTVDRVTQSFNYLSKKKEPIPDYAIKSPLKPCDNVATMNVSLKDGFPVYWKRLKAYEQANGIYFHTALVLINVAYAVLVFYLWRRRARLLRVEAGGLPMSTHA